MTDELRRRGRVIREPWGVGSKGEHEAVVFVDGDERMLLRRRGGPAYDDPEIAALVDHDVEVVGLQHGSIFLAVEWSVDATDVASSAQDDGDVTAHDEAAGSASHELDPEDQIPETYYNDHLPRLDDPPEAR